MGSEMCIRDSLSSLGIVTEPEDLDDGVIPMVGLRRLSRKEE